METLNLYKLTRNLEREGCHVAILPYVVDDDVVDPCRAVLRVEKLIFGHRYRINMIINKEELESSLYKEAAIERLEEHISKQFRIATLELTRKEIKDD